MSTELEDLVGSKLVIGVPGTKVTPEIVQHFRATRAGGIIFYRINFESPEQIRRFIFDLENALQRKLLVCVDHENGRVIMYRDGVTIFPDNLAFGTAGHVDHARKAGAIAAQELRALGTDINFAPVLDVLTETYSPNIGIRSFGMDWKVVSEMGAAYVAGLQGGGVSATVKHFPGKGHASVDAHLKLPTINSTWEEMKEVHLQPFVRAIQEGVDCVMTSHPKYPKIDAANIATFSRKIVTDYLRGELGFKGLAVSDDLEMGAIKESCPIDVAAVKTEAAGHDLILSCHDALSQLKAAKGLVEAYKTKRLPLRELEASVERVERIKAKRKKRFEGDIGPVKGGPELAFNIARQGTVVIQDPDKKLPLPDSLLGDVGILFPKLSSLAARIMIEKPFEDEIGFFHQVLGQRPGRHVTEVYSIDPTDEDIETAVALVRRSSVTLFFCFDAHLHSRQQELLGQIQKATKKLVMILLRDPYDKSFLRHNDTGLTAFGFRRCQIEAVVERIYGE